ncbi:hypothetical protein D3C73_1027800 [compost metagenome]
MHDLHNIALGQDMLGMTAAADDLAVDLHRHPALQQLLGRKQVQKGRRSGQGAGFAIELDVHGAIVADRRFASEPLQVARYARTGKARRAWLERQSMRRRSVSNWRRSETIHRAPAYVRRILNDIPTGVFTCCSANARSAPSWRPRSRWPRCRPWQANPLTAMLSSSATA